MSNVTFLDAGQQDIHELFAQLAEDAEVEGAVILVKKGGQLSPTGGNISIGELATAALLLDDVAKTMIFDYG